MHPAVLQRHMQCAHARGPLPPCATKAIGFGRNKPPHKIATKKKPPRRNGDAGAGPLAPVPTALDDVFASGFGAIPVGQSYAEQLAVPARLMPAQKHAGSGGKLGEGRDIAAPASQLLSLLDSLASSSPIHPDNAKKGRGMESGPSIEAELADPRVVVASTSNDALDVAISRVPPPPAAAAAAETSISTLLEAEALRARVAELEDELQHTCMLLAHSQAELFAARDALDEARASLAAKDAELEALAAQRDAAQLPVEQAAPGSSGSRVGGVADDATTAASSGGAGGGELSAESRLAVLAAANAALAAVLGDKELSTARKLELSSLLGAVVAACSQGSTTL